MRHNTNDPFQTEQIRGLLTSRSNKMNGEKKPRRLCLYAGVVGDYDGAYDWIEEKDFGRVENTLGYHEGAFPEDCYTIVEVAGEGVARCPTHSRGA